MANSIENVYSTALFQLCEENGNLDSVYDELTEVGEILFDESEKEYVEMLSSPLIAPEEKKNALEGVFGGKINDTTMDFLCLVTDKGRVRYLPAITKEFKDMYYEKRNILEVTATTSVKLSEPLSKKLSDKLAQVTGKTIILHEKLDKSILGGIVLRYGNTEIDSSVKTKLDNIKAQIDNAIV